MQVWVGIKVARGWKRTRGQSEPLPRKDEQIPLGPNCVTERIAWGWESRLFVSGWLEKACFKSSHALFRCQKAITACC